MHRIRRNWFTVLLSLLLPGLGVGMVGCKGCQTGSRATATQMQQWLPKDHRGLLILPNLEQLPKRLNALIQRFEGPQKPGQPALGQMRQYVQEFRDSIGVDLLDAQSFVQHGINPKASLLAGRVRIAGRKALVAVVPVSNNSRFEALMRRLGKQRLLVNHVVTKDGITTLYRKRKKGISEEFAYALEKGVAVVALPVIEKKTDQPTTHGADVIQALRKLKPAQSLKSDPTLQRKLKRWRGKAQVLLYMPQSPTKKPAANTKPGQQPSTRPTTRPGTQPSAQQAPSPLLQTVVKTLRRYNPLTESTTALSFGEEGIQVHAGLPVSAQRAKRAQSMVPPTGQAKQLMQLLHQRAIAGFKLSLNPKQLPSLVARALSTSRTSITPQTLYSLLQKHTGLDLQKDLIPALSGHAMLTLYHIYPQIYQRFQTNPGLLPSAVELAVVAGLKDRKKAEQVLDTLAKKLTIADAKVKLDPTHDKRKQYKIRAWPGAMAYWTIVDNYFIYALGKLPLKLAVQALRTPKYRLYPKTAPATLTANDSIGLHIHLPNLMRSFNSLYVPFALKMLVTNFYLMNLKNVEAIVFSYSPGQEQLELQLKLQLKQAKPRK